MSRDALMLDIVAGLSASMPGSVKTASNLRFILTRTAATLPILPMSTSMFGCPVTYGNLHGISTAQRAVQFCD